ncbi:hypothetical protein LTR86_005520 [Recurvomyces mirabilis]|nr:hypothetical protein LTR86_005520 [Recurvomyces mirabilis]
MSLIRPLRLLGSHVQAAKNTTSYFEGLIPSLAAQQTKTNHRDTSASAPKNASRSSTTSTAPKSSNPQIQLSSPNKTAPE